MLYLEPNEPLWWGALGERPHWWSYENGDVLSLSVWVGGHWWRKWSWGHSEILPCLSVCCPGRHALRESLARPALWTLAAVFPGHPVRQTLLHAPSGNEVPSKIVSDRTSPIAYIPPNVSSEKPLLLGQIRNSFPLSTQGRSIGQWPVSSVQWHCTAACKQTIKLPPATLRCTFPSSFLLSSCYLVNVNSAWKLFINDLMDR